MVIHIAADISQLGRGSRGSLAFRLATDNGWGVAGPTLLKHNLRQLLTVCKRILANLRHTSGDSNRGDRQVAEHKLGNPGYLLTKRDRGVLNVVHSGKDTLVGLITSRRIGLGKEDTTTNIDIPQGRVVERTTLIVVGLEANGQDFAALLLSANDLNRLFKSNAHRLFKHNVIAFFHSTNDLFKTLHILLKGSAVLVHGVSSVILFMVALICPSQSLICS